jgi:hypothetical protein
VYKKLKISEIDLTICKKTKDIAKKWKKTFFLFFFRLWLLFSSSLLATAKEGSNVLAAFLKIMQMEFCTQLERHKNTRKMGRNNNTMQISLLTDRYDAPFSQSAIFLTVKTLQNWSGRLAAIDQSNHLQPLKPVLSISSVPLSSMCVLSTRLQKGWTEVVKKLQTWTNDDLAHLSFFLLTWQVCKL